MHRAPSMHFGQTSPRPAPQTSDPSKILTSLIPIAQPSDLIPPGPHTRLRACHSAAAVRKRSGPGTPAVANSSIVVRMAVMNVVAVGDLVRAFFAPRAILLAKASSADFAFW